MTKKTSSPPTLEESAAQIKVALSHGVQLGYVQDSACRSYSVAILEALGETVYPEEPAANTEVIAPAAKQMTQLQIAEEWYRNRRKRPPLPIWPALVELNDRIVAKATSVKLPKPQDLDARGKAAAILSMVQQASKNAEIEVLARANAAAAEAQTAEDRRSRLEFEASQRAAVRKMKLAELAEEERKDQQLVGQPPQ
jgi:hypothetical protein